MELTTAEEIHVVCLFPDPDAAAAFGALVSRRLPPIANDSRIFGPQLYMDSEDGVLGEEPRLLLAASDIGVYEASALTHGFGGVAFPECSRDCPAGFLSGRPDLRGVPVISASDAHDLDQIGRASRFMELPSATPAAVLDWLRRGAGGVLHADEKKS